MSEAVGLVEAEGNHRLVKPMVRYIYSRLLLVTEKMLELYAGIQDVPILVFCSAPCPGVGEGAVVVMVGFWASGVV